MKPISRGYLTLTDGDVIADAWSVSLSGGSPLSNPSQVDDWSYFQALEISIAVVVDLEVLRSRLQLGPDAKLGLVIVWSCSGTSLRGSSAVAQMRGSETSVQLNLSGGLLRKDVKLECQITLLNPSTSATSELSPKLPGAILWATSCSIMLEGAGARMPILAVPFSRHLTSESANALWWLRIEAEDLDAPADASLWLWINDESPIIQGMLSKPSSERSKLTSALMALDLCRQLVTFALNNEEFDSDVDYDEGSLGAVVAAPIRLFNESTKSLRARFRDDPQRVEAELQARVGGLLG